MRGNLVAGVLFALALVISSALPVFGASAHSSSAGSMAGRKSCTPGYSPCIANKRSDVDCWGGSGNGPRYTKPYVTYRVTGSDRYGLDADHDGKGCE